MTNTFNGSGQLTNSGTNSYHWDAEGNPTDTGYSVNADNEITASPTDSVLAYNKEGELIQATARATGDTWFYGYNNAGQMVSASEYSASTGGALEQSVAYQYDAFGNRVQEAVTVGGVTTATQFGYNGWNPAKAGAVGNSGFDVFVEYTVQPNGQPAAATTTRYLDGNAVDQVFARIGATLGPAWLLQDKDMSVCDVIDGTGSLRDTIKYDAFGNVLTQTQITGSTATSETPQTDTWGGRYTFAGMQRDSATGLDHDNARDYSAIVGRFISQDPMGLSAGDSNLYRYVNNAPTNATDPSGLWKIDRANGATAVVTSDEGDTIGGLASKIGLYVVNYPQWLTTPNLIQYQTPNGDLWVNDMDFNSDPIKWANTKLYQDQKFQIPNRIMCLWYGDLGETGQALAFDPYVKQIKALALTWIAFTTEMQRQYRRYSIKI